MGALLPAVGVHFQLKGQVEVLVGVAVKELVEVEAEHLALDAHQAAVEEVVE